LGFDAFFPWQKNSMENTGKKGNARLAYRARSMADLVWTAIAVGN
jgi:hypothetical protein